MLLSRGIKRFRHRLCAPLISQVVDSSEFELEREGDICGGKQE